MIKVTITEDDIVTAETAGPYIRRHEVPPSKLYRDIALTGVLPPAVRWMSPERDSIIFERPPGRITVTYAPTNKVDAASPTAPRREASIPVPWQVYHIKASAQHMAKGYVTAYAFAAKEPISGPDTTLYHFPLPNVNRDGFICQSPKQAKSFASVTEMIAEPLARFWDDGFNENMYTWQEYHADMPTDWKEAFSSEQGSENPYQLLEWLEQRSVSETLTWDYKRPITVEQRMTFQPTSSEEKKKVLLHRFWEVASGL